MEVEGSFEVHDESTQRDFQPAKLPGHEFTNTRLITALQTSSFRRTHCFPRETSYPRICILILTLLDPNHPAAPLFIVTYSRHNCCRVMRELPNTIES